MADKTNKTTRNVLAVSAFILAVLFAVMSAGWIDVSGYWVPVIGVMLGLVVLFEAGFTQYFNKSGYRSLTLKDGLNFVSIIFAVGVIVMSLLNLPFVIGGVSAGVLDFFGAFGAVIGFGTAVFALFHMAT